MGARGYGISLRVFNSQDESMRGITTKTNNGLVFNVQNSQFLSWSLPTEEIFQVHGQNRVAPNLKWSIFVLSHKICHYPKQLNE